MYADVYTHEAIYIYIYTFSAINGLCDNDERSGDCETDEIVELR